MTPRLANPRIISSFKPMPLKVTGMDIGIDTPSSRVSHHYKFGPGGCKT